MALCGVCKGNGVLKTKRNGRTNGTATCLACSGTGVQQWEYQGKYGIEGGRTITVDGVPSVYLNIATEPKTGRYRMVPADADDLAKRIVSLLNQADADDDIRPDGRTARR